jgi:predicted nuclease of predicted toxin-antitoxin system
MPESGLHLLLDQNVPYAVTAWLRDRQPSWLVRHVKDLGFEGQTDEFLYRWAQKEKAIVLTFDEDFADSRMYPLGQRCGVIRLRVWPTTTEKTIAALDHLLLQLPPREWTGKLIIIDNHKIRLRSI